MKFEITFDRYEGHGNKKIVVESESMDTLITELYRNEIKEVNEEQNAHYSHIIGIKDKSAKFVEMSM